LPLSSGALLQSVHAAAGVRIRLGCGLEAIQPAVDRWLVHLSDGTTLHAGLVVAGIGIEPNDRLAREAGLGEGPGIPVDGDGRTCDPHIFAAGDVALQDCAWHGPAVRQETWNNANLQAARAAQVMAAELSGSAVAAAPHRQLPWFWSEQYGHDVQVLGAPLGADMSISVDIPSRGALQVFLRQGLVIGVVSFDRPREMRQLRKTLAMKDIHFSHVLQGEPA
jgi:3-phenylpropionate/trans-cinnamate dioxygenase ferredoxin reductase subunit